ncbi:MAG: tetratricopeptide repeat protein [Mariprofundaceae bacterium]
MKFLTVSTCLAAALLSACGAGTALQGKGKTEAPPATGQAAKNKVPIEQLDSKFLYLAAQTAMQQGNTELAIRFLDALVKRDAEAVAPRLQLAQLLVLRQKSEEALKHLEPLLLRTDLTEKQAWNARLLNAQALATADRKSEALNELTQLLHQNPAHTPTRVLKARILAESGQLDDALGVIDEGLQIKDDPELRLIQAQLFMRTGDSDKVTHALKQMHKLVPDDETPILMMSRLAIQRNDRVQAEELLSGFLAKNPNALRVSNTLGRLLVEEGRIAEAIIVYRTLASKTGGEPEVLNALGLLYYQHKDYEQAADTFRQSYDKQPTEQSRFYLAASLEALEQETEATQLYRQIQPEQPYYVDAQLRLAGLEYRHEHLNNAVKRLKKVIRKHPDTTDAYLLLSGIRLNQERYQLLLKETRPALTLRKVPVRLLFNRAVAFESLKNYEQVEASLKQVLAMDPKNSESLNFLGYAYAEQGIKLDEAESLIRRALDQKPDDGYYLDSLAWVYFQRGQFNEALRIQEKALQSIGDDPIMHEHMGDIFWRKGDKEKARTYWQRAVKLKHKKPALLRRKITKGL